MEERDADRLSDPIEKLISDEEAGALARFRSRDFAGRLKRAIAEDAGPVDGRPRLRKIPGAAWAAAGVLIIAGIVAYLVVPKRGPAGDTAETTRAAMIRLPGLDGLDLWAKDAALEPARLSPAPDAFAAVLAGIKDYEDARAAAAVDSRSRHDRAPHLGVEKLMEILIRDGAVEKVLSLISPKFKEG